MMTEIGDLEENQNRWMTIILDIIDKKRHILETGRGQIVEVDLLAGNHTVECDLKAAGDLAVEPDPAAQEDNMIAVEDRIVIEDKMKSETETVIKSQ